MSIVAPIPVPLPELLASEPFTPEQWAMLMSLMDTVIPSIRRDSEGNFNNVERLSIPTEVYGSTVQRLEADLVAPPDQSMLDEYLNEKPSENPEFQAYLQRTFSSVARPDARKGLGFILNILQNTVGSYILTGYSTPFNQQPVHIRQEILNGWRTSRIGLLPNLFKQLTILAKNVWFKTSPSFAKVTGFPQFPSDYKPGPQHEYEFLQFQGSSSPEVIHTDVIIVGSGCGGGVCAKILSEAGYDVVVVDKSYHFPSSQLPMTETAGGLHMFERGGSDPSDDGSTVVITPSVWGGGGTINWSACLQTQASVRKEWAEEHGLTWFATAEFQSALDRVCERMGVSADHIRHNHGNKVLLEGARRLGYAAKAVPQNTAGNDHYDGHCGLGCGAAHKQGPVNSWLPDAAKAGARFIEGFKVENILFDDDDSGQKKATGVKGLWTSRDKLGGVSGLQSERTTRHVIIRAKKVIISCGTLWSPIILLKSGLTNLQIGRNFYAHPTCTVMATFKEDVKPWEGGILTSVCTSLEDLDGHGHGPKLETMFMMPSWSMSFLPWTSGLDFKLAALKFRQANTFISITRDRDTGRIYLDKETDSPRVQYSPSAFDRANSIQGVLALCKIAYIMGATELYVPISSVEPFRRPASAQDSEGIANPSFAAWLETIATANTKSPNVAYGSAHQMGSNRMSISEDRGVVDPHGRVWGTQNLYVADTSVFPTASGVNPMITVMAIADHIARCVVKELGGEKSK